MLPLLHAAYLKLLVFFLVPHTYDFANITNHLKVRVWAIFLVPHTYDFANITIPSIQLPPSILVTLRLLTILRLGFELFFLVSHTYDFANIIIPSIQLPPAILVTFRLGIVSFLFYSLLAPPRPHYRSFNNTPNNSRNDRLLLSFPWRHTTLSRK
jgi:hypothetical protein